MPHITKLSSLFLAGYLLTTTAFSETMEEQNTRTMEAEPSEYQDRSVENGDFMDPLEPLNRFVFAVNDYADGAAIKPVAHLYEDVTPEPVRNGITNFMDNLMFPINFVNFILQGRFELAGHSLARFVVNTTVGVGGFFDPSTEFGLKKENTGFADTLGSWGMEAGPYFVLPLYGPSSFRGGIGKAADYFGHPLYLVSVNKKTRTRNGHHQWYNWYMGTRIVEAINLRQKYLKTVEDLKTDSIDYYVARRSLHAQETLEKQKKIREDRKQNMKDVDYGV